MHHHIHQHRPQVVHSLHSSTNTQHTTAPIRRHPLASRRTLSISITRATVGNGSSGNGNDSSSSSSSSSGGGGTNGSNPGSTPAAPLDNGGVNGSSTGGNGGGAGGLRTRPAGDGGENGRGPQAAEQLWLLLSNPMTAAAAAVTAVLLLAVARHAFMLAALDNAMATVMASLGNMADGPSTRDSVAALKRLLREVFADQLTIKQRLADAEKAAAAASHFEAADDFQLQRAVGSSSSTWARAPVRLSGHITAAGVLPWSQEASSADALSSLSGLGVVGAADAVLQLHSVLAGGKRRVTAEFCQAARDGAAAALQLQTLLLRVQPKRWLQLMIAPLGGSLDVLGRSLTPVRGDYGCTQALRKGHGLTVSQQLGSGKAISLAHRGFSATAGFFVGGASKTGIAHIQARTSDGHSLSLIAAHSRPRSQATHDSSSTSSSSSSPDCLSSGMRFLGVQSPHCSSPQDQQQPLSGQVLGAAGVAPLTDTLTATAWAERPLTGQAGWGVGLYCQPDQDGVELGMAVGKASARDQQVTTGTSRPVFCELSAKVPAGDGLSISPCAVYTYKAGASSLAYVMQSCWRF